LEEIVLSGLKLFAALLLVALYGLFVAARFAYTKLKIRPSARDSIGGLVLEALGRSSEVGTMSSSMDYVLRMYEVDGPRVARIVVREPGATDIAAGVRQG
jgi:CBS domain containing-hemolysin-like protein